MRISDSLALIENVLHAVSHKAVMVFLPYTILDLKRNSRSEYRSTNYRLILPVCIFFGTTKQVVCGVLISFGSLSAGVEIETHLRVSRRTVVLYTMNLIAPTTETRDHRNKLLA